MTRSGSSALNAALALRDRINPQSELACSVDNLAEAIDGFMEASWELRSEDIASIESVELDHIAETAELRQQLSKRFPNLGLYWVALDSLIKPETDGQLATGDAIDDIIDIWRELSEVNLLLDHHSEADALAGLKFRYRHHLYMHLLPLRSHLEELMFES